jgi:hypothetical protein
MRTGILVSWRDKTSGYRARINYTLIFVSSVACMKNVMSV